ncbi:MAG: hypothetical protein IJ815_05190 [Lachnospiraceae bacterium]|nr:hypothetical protein [Lachnospiraceae bacterium]
MVIVNTPFKKEVFRGEAESRGLVYEKTAGMKIYFRNDSDEPDRAVADALKKQCKKNTELAAIYFTVTVE